MCRDPDGHNEMAAFGGRKVKGFMIDRKPKPLCEFLRVPEPIPMKRELKGNGGEEMRRFVEKFAHRRIP